MAVVNRPPFWVPRPDDPASWASENYNLTVLQTFSLVPFALQTPYTVFYYGHDNYWTPNLDMFSSRFVLLAGGVEPFEIDWHPHYRIDDSASWVAAPLSSVILKILSAAKPIKPPAPTFTIDDPAVWSGGPQASSTLPYFTIGGQPRQFRPDFTLQETPVWTWLAENLSSGIQHAITSAGQVPPYTWDFTLNDPPPWQWSPPNIVLATSLPVIGAFISNWMLRYDDWDTSSQWTGAPLSFNQSLNTPTAPRNPFINWQKYWYAEPSTWSGEPINSAPLQMLTVGGQPPPFRWNFTLQETPVWAWMAELLNSATLQFLTAAGQPPQFKPNFTLNELPMWQGAPRYAAPISFFTAGGQPPTPRYVFPPDDASIWVGAPTFNTLSNLINAPPPPTVLAVLNPQQLLMV